jgi:hypothetical protein
VVEVAGGCAGTRLELSLDFFVSACEDCALFPLVDKYTIFTKTMVIPHAIRVWIGLVAGNR